MSSSRKKKGANTSISASNDALRIANPRSSKDANIPLLALFPFHFPAMHSVRRRYGLSSNAILLLWACRLLELLGYTVTVRKLRNTMHVYSKRFIDTLLPRLKVAGLLESYEIQRGLLVYPGYRITEAGYEALREIEDNMGVIWHKLVEGMPDR